MPSVFKIIARKLAWLQIFNSDKDTADGESPFRPKFFYFLMAKKEIREIETTLKEHRPEKFKRDFWDNRFDLRREYEAHLSGYRKIKFTI